MVTLIKQRVLDDGRCQSFDYARDTGWGNANIVIKSNVARQK